MASDARVIRFIACLMVVTSARAAVAQSGTLVSFVPSIITPEIADVVMEVEIPDGVTRLTLDFIPEGERLTVVALHDDGQDGDRAAGDRVYSAKLPAAPIRRARRLDDVNRVFIGYLNQVNGTTTVLRGNTFIDVWSDAISSYPVTRLSQFVQATSRIANIHSPNYFLTGNLSSITREFYEYFGDDYDVLNVVYVPSRFSNRTHFVVKNTIRGIGLTISDSTRLYGSAGRLQGISQFPIAGLYDGAETGFLHELGHRWINHTGIQPFSIGGAHWPLSTMATGIMGYSIAGGEGGSFSCAIVEEGGQLRLNRRVGAPGYNDLDLYLMGLLPAAEVREQIVFANQSAVTSASCNGETFTGAVVRADANTLIDALGRRDPAAGTAPTRFRTATILVTRDALASPDMMSFYSYMTERAEWRTRVLTHGGFAKETGQPFFVATGERGTLEVHLERGLADIELTPSTATTGESSAESSAGLQIKVASRSSIAPTAPVTFECSGLPAGASCTFEPATVTATPAGHTATLTINAGVAAVRGSYEIVVKAQAGDARHSTALTLVVAK